MSKWKSIPKIDAHIHILPDAVPAANPDSDDSFCTAGGVDKYLRLMDENNLTGAIVMPFNDPYLMSMDFTLPAVHENLLALRRRDSRLLAFADIDPRLSAEENLTQLRRIMPTGDFAGIKLHPANTGLPLDGPFYGAIFSYAESESIPVEVHSYPNSTDALCSPSRLKTVLARHPALRLSVAHLGGEQFEALLGLGVYANFSAFLPELVKTHGIAGANAILRRFGTNKLIFATDYPDSRSLSPGEIYDEYFRILDQMDFTDAELRAIARENLLRFLGLK